jgi:hypothetical protein
MYSRPIEIKTFEDYRIWIRFEDGTQGTIDLSLMAGHGEFKYWSDGDNFKKASINEQTNRIVWNEDIELMPNSLYLILKMKNMSFN